MTLRGSETELAGWGANLRAKCFLVEPGFTADVKPSLDPSATIARGLGRSYGDCAINAGHQVILATKHSGMTTRARKWPFYIHLLPVENDLASCRVVILNVNKTWKQLGLRIVLIDALCWTSLAGAVVSHRNSDTTTPKPISRPRAIGRALPYSNAEVAALLHVREQARMCGLPSHPLLRLRAGHGIVYRNERGQETELLCGLCWSFADNGKLQRCPNRLCDLPEG